MLAAVPIFYQPKHAFIPSRPSPLSERSVNEVPRSFTFTMATTPDGRKPHIAPQRAFKQNPIMQTRDAATKRRRDMFFNRVQRDREEKKWDARGEQIQRLDFFSEHKQWEAKKAREAPHVDYDRIEETLDESMLPFPVADASQPDLDANEVDHILAQEESELHELISSMEEQQNESSSDHHETASQHYGSDDEDYDSIFMECAMSMDVYSPQHGDMLMTGALDGAEEMDMS